jgi:hypothetical protein
MTLLCSLEMSYRHSLRGFFVDPRRHAPKRKFPAPSPISCERGETRKESRGWWSNSHIRAIRPRSAESRIMVRVWISRRSILRSISFRAFKVKRPTPSLPFLRVGHLLPGSLRNCANQSLNCRNGLDSVLPERTSSMADLSFLTTVQTEQPKRPDAQGGLCGASITGHSPDAPRYNSSRAFARRDLGAGSQKSASHTRGTSSPIIGRKISYPAGLHAAFANIRLSSAQTIYLSVRFHFFVSPTQQRHRYN